MVVSYHTAVTVEPIRLRVGVIHTVLFVSSISVSEPTLHVCDWSVGTTLLLDHYPMGTFSHVCTHYTLWPTVFF